MSDFKTKIQTIVLKKCVLNGDCAKCAHATTHATQTQISIVRKY